MKKTYSKPQILFEDFTLNTSIAGDCEEKTNTPAQRQCGLDFGAGVVFLEAAKYCTIDVPDNGNGDGEYNGLCYHVFSNGRNLFNS